MVESGRVIGRRGLIKTAGLLSIQELLKSPVHAGTLSASHIRKKAQDYYQPLANSSPPPSGSYFDILVIGSGYGSAVFASAVSEKLNEGSSLAILERGKEWSPGTFPETLTDYLSEIRAHQNSYLNTLLKKLNIPESLSWYLRGLENQLGLLDFYEFDDFSVIAGNGLGGTSLINANIALKPDDSVFNQTWPESLRGGALNRWFEYARKELRVMQSIPESALKIMLMKHASQNQLPTGFRRFDLLDQTVFLQDHALLRDTGPEIRARYQDLAVTQMACLQCGNCLSGCNVGAKNSLNQSSLAKAKAQGAQIFTQIEVESLEKTGSVWTVLAKRVDHRGEKIPIQLSAKNVVLGAGVLGTLKILFRSKSLSLSPALGKRFHGNGDDFGFISFRSNISPSLTGKGISKHSWDGVSLNQVSGTAIQSVMDFRDNPSPFLIEDLTLPSVFSIITRVGLPTKPGTNTGAFLLMEQEACDGDVKPGSSSGALSARWNFRGAKEARHALRKYIAPSMGGEMFFPDEVPGYKTTTAHPLGGACLSDHPDYGVVNDLGQVWDYSRSTTDLYQGLYIVDGSVIPSSLIANPLLTISAISARIADHFIHHSHNQELFRI